MKKIIGVMPLWDDEKKSIWMLPGYLDGIKEAGGLPIIFPMTEEKEEIIQLCELCDGFLFTGGHDVDPELYGEEPIPGLIASCKERDSMEKIVLEYAIKENKAVLGICRGIQFINVMLGGTLYQDIPMQHPSKTEHHMDAPYDRTCHKISIKKDSPLFQLLKTEELGVNSYHHQAIKDIAPGLTAMAESEDGLTEAVCMEEKNFVWALQWHPEFSHKVDENSRKIFAEFIKKCDDKFLLL
ncbi:MAG: gamma-glutamyl-gamma-aminobutyrate hydrolase family protein [Lachnospiraceae bacterium]|uniref:gamma-glutamyl-gamma-aminobutyrate hydrolase family protein n=1 Tax=Roseburia hominis TaxID=301301 RepID=UPI001F2558F9|nr:gamma-glutamyl-gamma-aminobutyrate hydrolase family protein [Roseburia hominis]MDD6170134.1 gamma-glutamyl-gamma-aminobutyrate hydrolase family protein [Lachnospiraceae bacterium]